MKKILIIVLTIILLTGVWVVVKKINMRINNPILSDNHVTSMINDNQSANPANNATSTSINNKQSSNSTSPTIVNPPSAYKKLSSPFGFLEGFSSVDEINYFSYLGAGINRDGRLAWEVFEKSPGVYDWSRSDKLIKASANIGNDWLFGINPQNSADKKKCRVTTDACSNLKAECTLCDVENYSQFFTAIVNRYKGKVKFWQIGNEENHAWKESPEKYADFVKINYDLLKKNCPDCQLVLGGVSSRPSGYYDFYKRVINGAGEIKKQGRGETFNVFDFHWAGWYGSYKQIKDVGNNQYYDFKKYVSDIKSDLKANNISAEIWITEMSTYSGDPVDGNPSGEFLTNPPQTERQQASELVKRYVYSFASGIKKVFWVKINEWYKFAGLANGFYDNVGLINNPQADGDSSKKLAYYSYKKMVETLKDSDWSNVQPIQEKDGVYVYKFNKLGKYIWVAWNDNLEEKQITISGITSAQVKITEAVSKYGAGKGVLNYSTAFNTETKSVQNDKATIVLKDAPVFIEE
ncbi:hypothetical protein COX67_02760 [Candidatus Falkowbacteria bacterium CG_4_10_14_0_2_um_filter_36_22]|nr:MAG: hypothetical protein COX67_02760 [Candidatus Falkowbacteria bacterium CG_4_10_14_0_2_um_filter_36_22]